MKKLNVFLLFPETDDEIIALGDQAENYEQISKNLNLFKNCINNKVEYHLFYDSDNLQSFKNKANELGKELSNCINNVRVLLGNKTTNISKNIIAKNNTNNTTIIFIAVLLELLAKISLYAITLFSIF